MRNYNFSLRALALAVATLFATTGCEDDSTTEEGGGNNGPATTNSIQIEVKEIAGTSATVTTTPASNSLTYLSDVVAKAEFEAYASAQAFAEADVDAIKAEALADGSTLAEYLVATGVLKSGVKSEKYSGLDVSTDYVVIAYGLSMDGEITTEVSTATFTTEESDPEPEKGPEAKVLIAAGEIPDEGDDFINKTTSITVGVQLTNETDVVTAVSELFLSTEDLEANLNYYGISLEELVDGAIQNKWNEVYTYSEQEVAFLNEKRSILGTYSRQDPDTSYTAVIKLTGSNGVATVVSGAATTESAGAATEAYNAWLGSWTVTSTSSTYSQQPMTFDIKIYPRIENHSYLIGGLTSSIFRDMDEETVKAISPKALFDSETGTFSIANQLIFSDTDEEGEDYDFYYNSRYVYTGDGKTYVENAALDGLIGTLNAGSTEAGKIEGATWKSSTGATIGTVVWMDYYFWYLDANGETTGIYGCNPAEMFTYTQGENKLINYPIGPFTLAKKTTTEPEPEPEPTPETSSLRKSVVAPMVHKFSKAHANKSAAAGIATQEKVFNYQNSSKEKLAAYLAK